MNMFREYQVIWLKSPAQKSPMENKALPNDTCLSFNKHLLQSFIMKILPIIMDSTGQLQPYFLDLSKVGHVLQWLSSGNSWCHFFGNSEDQKVCLLTKSIWIKNLYKSPNVTAFSDEKVIINNNKYKYYNIKWGKILNVKNDYSTSFHKNCIL